MLSLVMLFLRGQAHFVIHASAERVCCTCLESIFGFIGICPGYVRLCVGRILRMATVIRVEFMSALDHAAPLDREHHKSVCHLAPRWDVVLTQENGHQDAFHCNQSMTILVEKSPVRVNTRNDVTPAVS